MYIQKLIWFVWDTFYTQLRNLRYIVVTQKWERRDLFFSRIKNYPIFLLFCYLWLSFSDYFLSQDITSIDERLTKMFYEDNWVILVFDNLISFIICCHIYFFLSSYFIDIYKYIQANKFFFYSLLWVFFQMQFYLYWETLFLAIFEFTIWGAIIYFFLYWTGIIIQWAVDLEEDIDAKEDKMREIGGKIKYTEDELESFTLINFFFGTTEVSIGETPQETIKRYYKEQKELGISQNVKKFRSHDDHRKYLRKKIFIKLYYRIRDFDDTIKILFIFFFNLYKHGMFRKTRAVGSYSLYNAYWSVSSINSLFTKTTTKLNWSKIYLNVKKKTKNPIKNKLFSLLLLSKKL